MVTFSLGFEMFRFSVMESSFYQRRIHHSSSSGSFIDDLGPLRSVQTIFVWKIGFNAASALEYDLEIDKRVENVYAGFQKFRDLVTVKT